MGLADVSFRLGVAPGCSYMIFRNFLPLVGVSITSQAGLSAHPASGTKLCVWQSAKLVAAHGKGRYDDGIPGVVRYRMLDLLR